MSFPDLASMANQINPMKGRDPNAPGGPPPDPRTLPQPTQPNTVRTVDPSPPPTPQQPQQQESFGPPSEPQDDYRGLYDGPGPWRTTPEQPAQYSPAHRREFGEWGRPWWPIEAGMSLANIVGSPFMPSPYESYNVIRGAGRQLGMFASPGVGQPAARAANFAMMFAPLLDALSKGQFSRNFNAARMGTLKMQQQQMMLDAEISQQRHQDELMKFGRVFELAKIGAISHDDARNQVRDLAIATGHQYLLGVLNTKDLGGVEEYLAWEDQKMRDMWASTTTLRKATGGETDADIAREYGRGTGAALGGGSTLPTKQGYSQDQKPPEETAQADTGSATDATPAEDFNETTRKRLGMTPEEYEDAQAIASGQASSKYDALKKAKTPLAGQIRARIDNAADAIRNRTNHIVNGAGTPDQKVEALSAIQPATGNLMRGLLDLSVNPETDIPAKGGERERMVAMAHAINPHWKANSYKLAQQYEELNKPAVKTVQRVAAFIPAVNSLNSALLRIPEDQKIPTNIVKALIADKWSGDPAYAEIYTAIQNVLNETAAIQSGTGQPRVTNIKMRAEEMLKTMSPAQIRAQLLIDAQAAYGYVRDISGHYKEVVGDPKAQAPFYTKQTEQDYKAILRMNPYTGEMPADASASVRATGRQPGGPKPSWLTPEMSWKPLTEQQVIDGRRQIRENQNSTDPNVQAAIQRIRRRLGIFATPEIGDEDYERPR